MAAEIEEVSKGLKVFPKNKKGLLIAGGVGAAAGVIYLVWKNRNGSQAAAVNTSSTTDTAAGSPYPSGGSVDTTTAALDALGQMIQQGQQQNSQDIEAMTQAIQSSQQSMTDAFKANQDSTGQVLAQQTSTITQALQQIGQSNTQALQTMSQNEQSTLNSISQQLTSVYNQIDQVSRASAAAASYSAPAPVYIPTPVYTAPAPAPSVSSAPAPSTSKSSSNSQVSLPSSITNQYPSGTNFSNVSKSGNTYTFDENSGYGTIHTVAGGY